jgi:KDO2-lipid IV(A) lauroyltransferase
LKKIEGDRYSPRSSKGNSGAVALDFAFYRRMAYLDRSLTRVVSRGIGRIILPWLGRKRLRHLRDASQGNLEVALAAANPNGQDAGRLARRTFSNFGAYIADYFLLPFVSRRSVRRWVTRHAGTEHLDAAVARGCGVLLLTCHVGLWELGGIYLKIGGYDINVVGLVDKVHTGITEFRDWMRRRHGIGVVNRDGVHLAALTIRQMLAEGKTVALLGDRLIGEKGVEVDYMGRRVAFPTGPFRLAHATDATVLTCHVVREGRGYVATIEAPVKIPEQDGGPAPDFQAHAQEVARRFERAIRSHIDQWYVFYPFWENPPQGFEL